MSLSADFVIVTYVCAFLISLIGVLIYRNWMKKECLTGHFKVINL